MTYEKSVKIYNFFDIFFHFCPSPLTRPPSFPQKPITCLPFPIANEASWLPVVSNCKMRSVVLI
ncbi:hypothetical protein HanRHA438_Chr15g0697921 [Helianthus annuus]|nr:hypothetical protein HanIR_Chr15g0745131 [Helianthus annuus]KAJ0830649.1 hypothetical protein HanPSC8_Chr15g0657801 [Helianthus annuus]KAJ0844035.1 hypothetical protein HanRHA438_Chr15g0697921 [Helianthus annuus]